MAGSLFAVLVALVVVPSAALVHSGGLTLRCTLVRHRCAPPLASDRISDTHRKHALQKQQERQIGADRAERSLLEQQQISLNVHRAAIQEFEVSRDWRATLNELHRLQKQGIEPDVACIEAAARTLASANKWQHAGELAQELQSLRFQPSESQAAAVMVEALARRGSLSACLELIASADHARLALSSKAREAALTAAAADGQWEQVLTLHRRLNEPVGNEGPPPPPPVEILLPAIRAYGHLGQWQKAVRLAVQASRRGVGPHDELWASAAEACVDCATTSTAAPRTARRLLAVRPAPAVASAAMRALAAAEQWDMASRVAVDMLAQTADQGASGPSCFEDVRAWESAMASAAAVGNVTLVVELARCSRVRGQREAHATAVTACSQLHEWQLAIEHLPHARPLSVPGDETAWLMGVLAANKAGQHTVVVELFQERLPDLSSLSDDALRQALPIGLDAAQRSAQPREAVSMLTAAPRAGVWGLWEPALSMCVEAGHSRLVIDALMEGGASQHAETERGVQLLSFAVDHHLSQTLAAPALELIRTSFSMQRLSSSTQQIGLGMNAAEMAISGMMARRAGLPPTNLPDFNGRRFGLISIGSHLHGLRQLDATSPWLLDIGPLPMPKRWRLIVDAFSLMGFEPTPELQDTAKRVVRDTFTTVKRKIKAESDEEVSLLRMQGGVSYSKAAENQAEEALSMLGLCAERNIELSLDVEMMALQLFDADHVNKESKELLEQQRVQELLDDLAAGREPASLPGYIATLSFLSRGVWSGIRSPVDAENFLAATEQLTTFLEYHKQGSEEERELAYALLADLLLNRLIVPIYIQYGNQSLAWSEAVRDLDRSGVFRPVIRIAAQDNSLTPDLLRWLMVDYSFSAAELVPWVDAGGRPTGDQLALTCLGALGFTTPFVQNGASVMAFHNTTTVREAWYDLKSIWELVVQPEVQSKLWPELEMSMTQRLEPLQDIVLLSAIAQVSIFASDGTGNPWEFEDLKAEVRGILNEMGFPSGKIDAFLQGSLAEVSSRASELLNIAYVSWLNAGGWSVERRMFAPLLSRALYALDEDQPVMFGMRIDASGQWEHDGTITPRLDLGLRNQVNEHHAWAMRVVEQIMSSSAIIGLLIRAEKCIVNEEALVLGAQEAKFAKTVEGLFGLDLAGLDAWTEPQKTDLRTSLSYMREVLRNKAMLTTSLTTGKQRQAVPKGRGFGGGSAGKAGGKGPKKKRR